jgi:hypothetical protein
MIVTTVITILGELVHPLMRLLTALTGHHWVTKNFLSVIVFIVVLVLTSRGPSENTSPKVLIWIPVTGVLCALAMFVFFVIDLIKG